MWCRCAKEKGSEGWEWWSGVSETSMPGRQYHQAETDWLLRLTVPPSHSARCTWHYTQSRRMPLHSCYLHSYTQQTCDVHAMYSATQILHRYTLAAGCTGLCAALRCRSRPQAVILRSVRRNLEGTPIVARTRTHASSTGGSPAFCWRARSGRCTHRCQIVRVKERRLMGARSPKSSARK